jgi:hypothetical protein
MDKSFIMPANYPLGCSDEEISEVISQMAQIMIDSGGNINQTLRLGPMISAGQIELQRRITARDLQETEQLKKQINKLGTISRENAESSKLFSSSSTKLSRIAIIISVISLLVGIVFAAYGIVSQGKWEKEQLNTLKEIRDKRF